MFTRRATHQTCRLGTALLQSREVNEYHFHVVSVTYVVNNMFLVNVFFCEGCIKLWQSVLVRWNTEKTLPERRVFNANLQ